MSFIRLLSVACGAIFALTSPVYAETFVVDSDVDSPDAKVGDGKCESEAGGCTLRAAVQEANASDRESTVAIPPGVYTLAIPPTGPDLGRSGTLYLRGVVNVGGGSAEKTIIDGGGIARVFEVAEGATVEISGLTVRNGLAKGGNGGGILTRGSTTLQAMIFEKNRATADPGQSNGRGGGIHNDARLSLTAVTIDENTADGRGGGLYNGENGNITMMNGRVHRNTSLTDDGGGISNSGSISMGLLPITGNKAAGSAGGIDNIEGSLEIFDAALLGNTAGADGGGLRNSGKTRVRNTTIGGNRAGASGAGIDNRASGRLALANVTVARNGAGTEQKGEGGGIRNGKQGRVEIANTLVAENTVAEAPSDCSGTIESGGYNLFSTSLGCDLEGDTETNLVGKPAGLAPLAANGGPSPSYALTAESAAIDAGNPKTPNSRDGSCLPVDCRGVKRPLAGRAGAEPRCDIGALEFELAEKNEKKQ